MHSHLWVRWSCGPGSCVSEGQVTGCPSSLRRMPPPSTCFLLPGCARGLLGGKPSRVGEEAGAEGGGRAPAQPQPCLCLVFSSALPSQRADVCWETVAAQPFSDYRDNPHTQGESQSPTLGPHRREAESQREVPVINGRAANMLQLDQWFGSWSPWYIIAFGAFRG